MMTPERLLVAKDIFVHIFGERAKITDFVAELFRQDFTDQELSGLHQQIEQTADFGWTIENESNPYNVNQPLRYIRMK